MDFRLPRELVRMTHLWHDPAVVTQEVERSQALDVQVDVDASELVQKENPHCICALDIVLVVVVPASSRSASLAAMSCFEMHC